MALSWEEIVERGKQHNKTVICEVEKRGRSRDRYFLIKCNVCGLERETDVHTFFRCSKCNYKLRNNTEIKKLDFIHKAKTKNGDKFDYSLVEYFNSKSNVKIICNNCKKVFHQLPDIHLDSYGCICYKRQFYKEKFLISCNDIYGDKFNYDLIEYNGMKSKLKILCNQCNKVFEQRASSHLNDRMGCPYCAIKRKTSNTEQFILKSQNKQGNKYDYTLVEYVNNFTKLKIICKKCNNIFLQKPCDHLRGNGCPKCFESKGENRVAKYLSKNNIEFMKNKTFKTLKDKGYLKPDFYLSELDLFIEYDGEGHFFPCFGSTPEEKQKNLEDCQRRDKIKNDWALKNNIPLLRIPHWDYDRIEELIDAFILEHTRKKEVKQLVLEGI